MLAADLNPQRTAARTVRLRMLALAALLLVARLALIDHPVPVHGDDERFALGVVYLDDLVFGASDRVRQGVLAPTGGYPVHHPGYPLWVVLAVPFYRLGLSPYAALTLWTVVASVLGPLALYRLAASFVSDATAWWLALAYSLGPMHWFLSVTALNYTAASAAGLGVVWFVWRSLSDATTAGYRSLGVAVLLLAVACGVRPDLLLWYGPLVLWAAWRRGWRSTLTALVGLLTAAAIWTLLLAWLYESGTPVDSGPRLDHTLQKLLATSVFRLGLIDGPVR
ncbi:MAG: hypothetical protein V3T70_09670, partial [Phycisphaerae bacterium]